MESQMFHCCRAKQPAAVGNPIFPARGDIKALQRTGNTASREGAKGTTDHQELHLSTSGTMFDNDVIEQKNLGQLHCDVILIPVRSQRARSGVFCRGNGARSHLRSSFQVRDHRGADAKGWHHNASENELLRTAATWTH